METDERVARLAVALEAHRPGDARERRSLERFQSEITRLNRPFDRESGPIHVTASAIVVGPAGVCLHVHKRLGRWLQPGGHVDDGEQPEAAAIRETFEETGLSVKHPAAGPRLIHVDVHEAAQGHTHLDLRYLVRQAPGILAGSDPRPARLDPARNESRIVAWCSWELAIAVADASLEGAIRAAAALGE